MRQISSVLVMIIAGCCWAANGDMGNGDGSQGNPYRIQDVNDFQEFCSDLTYRAIDVYTRLESDLDLDPDLSGRQSYTTAAVTSSYAGYFDGAGHTISHLTIDTNGAGTNQLGLFWGIGAAGQVRDLHLVNCSITGGVESDYVGGLCGRNYGSIMDCDAGGTVSGDDYLGGLCGRNDGSLTGCHAVGSISGDDYLGGLCGSNYQSIQRCSANSTVSGDYYVGGLCGMSSSGTIHNSYAGGQVTGNYWLGGVCGYNRETIIANCYAACTVGQTSGSGYYWGGVVGENGYKGSIISCYAAGVVVSGTNYRGALCGKIHYDATITDCFFYLFSGPDNGLGTVLDESLVLDEDTFAGFDFAGNSDDGTDDDWTLISVFCPKLTWQAGNGPVPPSVSSTTLTGSGYADDPLQINSEADFSEFASNDGLSLGYYILTTDIDLTGEAFTAAAVNREFGGHFDGGEHAISNLVIDTEGAETDYLGLFGTLSASAVVTDLGIVDCNILGGEGSNYLGALCGRNYGNIRRCYSTGSVFGGGSSHQVGGLVGSNGSNNISRSYSIAAVKGDENIGGLCGYNSAGSIANCFAAGSVDGKSYTGGLCGYNYNGSVNACYAAGKVSRDGLYNIGGLCGRKNMGTVNNSYFYLFSGPDNGLGTILDESQVTAEKFVGFDFAGDPNDGTDDNWAMVSGHCPKLTWQTDDGPPPPTPPITTLTGSGYSNDSFQINSDSDFTEFMTNSELMDGYYRLNTDIDLSEETFTAAVINRDFYGHFDGDGHIVSNLTIDTAGADDDYLGLFRRMNDYSAEIKNLGVVDCNIIGGDDSSCLGGLCAVNSRGTIANCYTTGSVRGGQYVGGLTGDSSGIINNCFSTCSVYSHAGMAGGLCGDNGSLIDSSYASGTVTGGDNASCLGGFCGFSVGTISKCYAAGDVSSGDSSSDIGGFCGENTSTFTIKNCYAVGAVVVGDNASRIGGLCGNNDYGRIHNCYAVGPVVSGSNVDSIGGLVGSNGSGTTSDSFWDIETSGLTASDGGAGKTTAEMMTESTFASWTFHPDEEYPDEPVIWMMLREGEDYPRLTWQTIFVGDIAGLYGTNLVDFAYLANYWQLDDCGGIDDCGRADIDADGIVGLGDLDEIVTDWMKDSF